MNNGKRRFIDGKFVKSVIVIAGIVFGQAVLYGPSLVGQKILLPLDILAQPGIYIPPTPGMAVVVPQNSDLSDLVLQREPARQFAISELHQGRLPLWAPYQYGGVPFFIWPRYSPFLLLECCTRSPVILAWAQLLVALVAGVGMFFFCRQSLRVGFWPAAVCAWCYPLTGFFVLWQGYLTAKPVCWLPWLFLAVDKTVRGKSSPAPIALSVVTFLVLTSGKIDVSGQVLLGSGIYALWCLWRTYPGEWFRRKSRSAVTMLILGWGLGFLLAAPYFLPVLEYAKTGSRMIHRSAGAEERPPVGLAALPQVVLPDIYGTSENGSTFVAHAFEGNLLESPSAAYTGVLPTLLVAPLAWCSRRHRAVNLLWIFLAFFGLSWCLDVPGFVNLLRLPALNMMSHNRLVFLTSFAILAMTAMGLEALLQAQIEWRRWFWIAAALLAGLCVWCIYLSILPGQLPAQLESFVSQGKHLGKIRDMEDVWRFQAWFTLHYAVMAAFCLVGFAGWLLVYFQGSKSCRWFPMLAICLVGDLLWFGYGLSAQCNRGLYYPKIPVLDRVAQSVPGRVIGVHCLPAPLAMMAGLSDIRGYDAVDPARMVNLLKTAVEPGKQPPNAAVQYVVPKETIQPPDTLRLPPVLNMLDVRYLIFQGKPPPDIRPPFQEGGYWALVNSNALPRVFVPKSVETISNAREQLKKLASPQFDPANVAYVETPVKLPALCRGVVRITNEIPTRIMISAHMETPGLVVLADNWEKGWQAYWNGKPVSVLRTDYAVRGVVLPAGNGTLEFVYRPRSLIVGLWLAALGVIILSAWVLANGRWIRASHAP